MMMGMYDMELICPAGTLAGLKVAVNAGADVVYCGFNNETNARNFPGLNFSKEEMREGILYAKKHNVKVFIAINTYPRANNVGVWEKAIDDAYECGAYAVILADIGLLDYAKKYGDKMRRHLSVQATASTKQSISYFVENYGVSRVVLPRVVSVDTIKDIAQNVSVELEVFVYGGLCVMAEGKCSLSSYVTGLSPNKEGVCSPDSFVEYQDTNYGLLSKLNGSVINSFHKNESPGYPTICKGRFIADSVPSYLFEEPTSLSIVNMLPELAQAGVKALKIEGRQRSKSYVDKIVRSFRKALDDINNGREFDSKDLIEMAEGNTETTGAYVNKWL
jgi:putative protease